MKKDRPFNTNNTKELVSQFKRFFCSKENSDECRTNREFDASSFLSISVPSINAKYFFIGN